jgi:hypothetical protein
VLDILEFAGLGQIGYHRVSSLRAACNHMACCHEAKIRRQVAAPFPHILIDLTGISDHVWSLPEGRGFSPALPSSW